MNYWASDNRASNRFNLRGRDVVPVSDVELVCCPPPACCDMRGYLSFSILYLLGKKPMYGSELAGQIARRKFERPNPGTIYPALRDLQGRGLIRLEGRGPKKVYRLTREGRAGLREAARYFVQAYADVVDDVRAGRL